MLDTLKLTSRRLARSYGRMVILKRSMGGTNGQREEYASYIGQQTDITVDTVGDHEYVKLKLASSEAFISVDVPLLPLQEFSAF